MNKTTIAILATFAAALYGETLEEKVNRLEKELNAVKAQQLETAAVATFSETKAFKDKLNWTPELRVRTDSFRYKNKEISGHTSTSAAQYERESGYQKSFNPATNVRLRLNMDYAATDETKFVGRMSVNRNTQTSERICTLHAAKGYASSTTTVFEIDKAYVDTTFNKKGDIPITLTFGILPTSGGSSTNLAENKPRQSMFPSLMFDMNSYGIIGTIDLDKYVTDGAIRGVFAKAYTQNKDSFYYQCNRAIVKNGDIAGLFYEQTLPYLGDNTFMIGVNRLGHIRATPFIGSAAMLDSDTPADLGSILNYGANLELRDIGSSQLTGFFGVAASQTNPSGNSADYTSTAIVGGTLLGARGLDYAFGEMYRKSGWATHIGGLYNFSDFKTKIGLEYNHGSQYWYSGTQGAEDPFNKLAVRGNAYEAYAIYNINKNIFLKAGYLRMEEQYTGSGWHFGTAYEKDAITDNGYILLNAAF